MSLKNRLCQLGLLLLVLAAVPLWGQSQFSISCPSPVAPGTDVLCSVNLVPAAGTTITSLAVGIQISPVGAGTPDLDTNGSVNWDGYCSPDINSCNSTSDLKKNGAGGFLGTNPGGGYNSLAVLFSVSSGAITISNAPVVGMFDFTVPASAAPNQTYSITFTNALANSGNNSLPVTSTGATVAVQGLLTFNTPSAGGLTPQATIGAPYSATFTATGGITPYTWTVNANSLPTGLGISKNASGQGVISGNVDVTNQAGNFGNIVITVTDSESPTVSKSQTYNLQVNAGLSNMTPTTFTTTQGNSFSSGNITVLGGTGPYNWTTTAPLATYGLTLVSGTTAIATISGTTNAAATAASPITIPLTVTDVNGALLTQNLKLTVQGPLVISGASAQPIALPTATVGTAYPEAGQNTTLTATGGAGGYTWSLASGSNQLPTGINLTTNASHQGVISGNPSVANTPTAVTVTVQVTDGTSTVTQQYTLLVNAAISITAPTALPGGTSGATYLNAGNPITATATGGSGSYTWSISGLAGVSFGTGANAATLTGAPQSAGTVNVTITATDANFPAVTATKTYTNIVIANGVSISAPAAGALAAGTVGVAYSQNITTQGGTAAYTWVLATGSGPLPGGLNLTPNSTNSSIGVISGIPNGSAGTASFTVQVTDSTGSVSTRAYTIQVYDAPSLPASTTLPVATVAASYNAAATNPVVVTGGAPTISWALNTGSTLPTGLNLNAATGAITGNPGAGTNTNTGPGTADTPVSITLKVTDGNGATATGVVKLSINPQLKITTASLLPATQNGPYTPGGNAVTLAGSGGGGTYSWGATGLPGGLTLGTNGTFTGSPNASGNFTAAITLTDGNSITATASLPLTVNPTLTITTAALPAATINAAYSTTLASSGGTTTTLTWSITGTPPPGLSIGASTGVLAGNPTGASGNVGIKLTDYNGAVATASLPLTINAAPSLTSAATLPVATVGVAYTSGANFLAETGGTAPLGYSTAQALPSGLFINATTGVITGTPGAGTNTNTGPGNANTPVTVNIVVTDTNKATSTTSPTLTINPALAITTATLPTGIPGVAYTSTTMAASGGGGGYTWVASNLPNGLTFTAAGVLAGTPTGNGGTSAVKFTVTDVNQVSTSATISLTIAPPLSITTTSLPVATLNVAYVTATVAATGGTAPYTWSASGLPAGLSINSATGVITGSPTTVTGSPFLVTFTVKDANSTIATAKISLTVNSIPLQMVTGVLPIGVINVVYPVTQLQATGGAGNYSWTASGLPPGLVLDPNGFISGTPTSAAGSPYSVKLTVTDVAANSVSRTIPLTISTTLAVALPTTLPAATLNFVYAPITFTAGGGASPYTWTATGLPAGLTLGISTGILSGTPTTAAGSPYAVTVTVKDSTGHTASFSYSLVVNSPLSISGPASLPSGTVGTAYAATTVTATGGSGVYTFTAIGLPAGLSISSAGVISGTPAANAAGASTVNVTVTDSTGATASQNYPVTINPAQTNLPTISSVSTVAGPGVALTAPNTWMGIYGSNFFTVNQTDTWTHLLTSATSSLPTILDGVSVMVGGVPAYVEYVSSSQINVLTGNIGFGPLTVTVTTTAGTSAAFNVTSQQAVPGIFPWPNTQPVATHADYTYAVAPGTFPTLTTVAAKPGETIVLWGSGFGPTTPAYPFGVAVPATSTYNTSSNVTATLNGAPVPVYQNVATLTSGNAGLYQLGITIPATLANGSYALTVSVNGVTSPNTLMLTVHN